MASSSALEALPSPLRDLVATAASSAEDFGTSDKDKVDVSEWIIKVAKGDVVQPSATKDLESMLTPKTYLVSNYLTAADIALYGALHPMLSQLQPPQYYLIPSITRYFDHIQNRPSVRKAADSLSPAYSLVTFDLDNMPKLERKTSSKKKEEITNETVNAAKITKDAVPKDDKKTKEKKQPKEKGAPEGGKKSGGKNISSAVAEDAGEPVPSMIDLRVGKIVDIKKHPDADSLYVEQIDFGEETGPRTVVSGLVNYIPIENMRDKILVGVCNLKPANMRGIKSFAMVLCASSKEGKEGGIELIQPPPDSQPGDRIYFEGEKFENASPLSQLNPKKKIFETVQPGFTTLESREAAWIDPVTKSVHKIRSAKGVCQAPTLVGASLS
ncbi:nucleic acid-binding protein [Pyrrhoderma noxium]|uniref:Nucleic acid-binding protein n=1 Tax=Pyrrhoderma noxium TaxID=2282107 RepID=A0A286UBJ0_9AGAM|nr:nucleic acid-binding protein [Pyrrhoderma noxium]